MAVAVTATGLLPVVFDPDTDALNINDGTGYVVHADLSMPPPPQKPQYASSIDTEGSRPVPDSAHYENREIGLTVRVYGDGDAEVEDRLAALEARMGQIHRKGGVLGVTTPAGRTIFFDLLGEAEAEVSFGESWLRSNKTDVTLRLVAAPFWRGNEISHGTFTRSAANIPVAVFTTDVGGDVPALGRMVYTDTSGHSQWVVYVGVENTYYNPDSDAALWYPATSTFTPLGRSTDTTLTIANSDLTSGWQAVLSSNLVGGAMLNHQGSFRMISRTLRPLSNTGQLSVQVQYGSAGRWAYTDQVQFGVGDREGQVCVTDLGVVNVDSSDGWEFRINAKSTVSGDELQIIDVGFIPTTDGTFMRVSAKRQIEVPTTFVGYDQFDQTTAGNLTGKTMEFGGTWGAGGADPTDFTVDTAVPLVYGGGHNIHRSEINDANQILGGRAALMPTAATDQAIQGVTYMLLAGSMTPGQIFERGFALRYVDANNGLVAGIREVASPAGNVNSYAQAVISKRVAGVDTDLLAMPLFTTTLPAWLAPIRSTTALPIQNGYGLYMFARVDATGLAELSVGLIGSTNLATFTAWHPDLAQGGALASGTMGLYDRSSLGTGTFDRHYDTVSAYVPTADAAVFANRELEISHDGVRRQDATGALHTSVSEPRGHYLRLKPGRNRLAVWNLRNDPAVIPNDNVDSGEAELFVTERGLVVPAA